MNEAPQPVKDWVLWHQAYEDPASSLSRRLAVVRKRLSEVLDAPGDRPTKLLSLCAGDGRDVIPVLAGPPVHIEVDALLVEWDQRLVGRAVVAAEEAELVGVTIRYADAGYPASFADFLPVDVLMLGGIFGYIEHSAVRTVIQDVRPYLRDDGTVIWTRGAPYRIGGPRYVSGSLTTASLRGHSTKNRRDSESGYISLSLQTTELRLPLHLGTGCSDSRPEIVGEPNPVRYLP
jgi:hypothetical protein